MKRLALVTLGLVLFASGCGGGAHTMALTPAPQASAGAAAAGTARFALTIPNASTTSAHGRRPAFVSPSTLSGTIQVNGGAVTELDLSLASPNCATIPGGRSCVISVAAPIGVSDTFALVLYDGAFAGGVHTGTALSAASNFTAAVTEGQANVTVPLVLGGVPAAVDVAAIGSLAGLAASTVPLVVTAYDAQHNTIVGGAAYVDAGGNAAPLNVTVTTPAQLTLHDGAQSATTVHVAGPTDAVTLQLALPATILGTYVKVQNSALVTLPAVNQARFIAVSGSITATPLAAQFTYFPDDIALAPSDATLVTGVPNGFAFSITSASGGGFLGFFNSATETLQYCSVSSFFTLGIAPMPSGIASAFNGADNVDTPPLGITYFPSTSLTNGACAGGVSFTSNPPGTNSFAESLAFDSTNNLLFEGQRNGSLDYDSFTAPSTLAGNTQVSANASPPHDMLALSGTKYFLLGTASSLLYTETAHNTPVTATGGGTLTALAAAADGRIYALDTSGNRVWVYAGGASLSAYTAASAFSSTPASTSFNLAIGPDGNAYATDGSQTVESVSPTGTIENAVAPPPGGNAGFLHSVFDGHNGFVYVYYDDGLHNGTQNVFRISH